jgi:hypothetical protein
LRQRGLNPAGRRAVPPYQLLECKEQQSVISRRNSTKSGTSRRGRSAEPVWASLRDEQLLELRLCDLGVRIEGTALETRIQKLYDELQTRDIKLRPHCWLAEEWFSPEGIPGIAIPFYLAHPRLMRLERHQMLEVEGGNERWCMKILRHEAGHAIDTAYRLYRRRIYRDVFGKSSQPYPTYYQPRPYSKRFVLHLDYWYAQSHPVEDFAETFAVWLKPNSRWRSRYRTWPALKKLRCVDALMSEVRGKKPPVTSRVHVDPLKGVRKTLREHYQAKRAHYGVDYPQFYDRDLLKLFTAAAKREGSESAAKFLRRVRPELRRMVGQWTGQYQYTIDQVLGEMIDRCRELNLRRERPEEEVKLDAMVLLTVQTMNYLHGGHHRIAL